MKTGPLADQTPDRYRTKPERRSGAATAGSRARRPDASRYYTTAAQLLELKEGGRWVTKLGRKRLDQLRSELGVTAV